MKTTLLFILLSLFIFSSYSQSPFDKALSEVSADIADKLSLKGKKKTVVLYITDINKAPSVAGKYLADIISSNIVNYPGNFMVFDRDNLSGIAEINTLIAEGYLTEDKTQKIGRILSVESIIVGTYTVLSNTIKLSTKALDVSTAFVIASSLKDLPLDNDAGALLGINVSSSNGSNINSQNRGFNNVPLNSNENYNNPATVDKSCETNNTGDFCFKNGTRTRIQIYVQPMRNSLNEQSCGGYSTLILEVDETKCLYSLKTCVTKYTVTKESFNHMTKQARFASGDTYTQGQIFIEQCKSKTLEIK